MSLYTLDANAVSVLLRGDPRVTVKVRTVVAEGYAVTLNAMSYFEVKRGLFLPRFERRLRDFMVFVEEFGVLPLDVAALDTASGIYQALRQAGTPLEDADILVAAIAISHNAILVTRNLKHFGRIEGLRLETWEDV